MTTKSMARRENPRSEDHVTEFYRGDAVALGDHESVGYLIKLANQMVLRSKVC